ncbi:DNA-binding protein SMUBP-2-like protein [Leptotrombidium deliense]|uniref:DNA helicase n=1 Tax=Leptotrombidium deliense TaxID=299467 RepID=A0A443SEK0_9ACAR|nr:DNA-binding protein SMUBP-2-like protein [Leptotrombidium deliense]
MNSVSLFVSKHLKLIEDEHNEELNEKTKCRDQFSTSELLKKGICINKLRIINLKTGLYGRYIITFTSTSNNALASHCFTAGDILGVYHNKDRELIVSGVVTSITEANISVAIDENCDTLSQDETNYCLIKLSNDVTYRRLKNALNILNRYPTNNRASNLIAVLFGKTLSEPLCTPRLEEIKFVNKQLNDSQRESVMFALRQKEVAIIHGPPGTGKTTTLVEYVVQEILRNLRVLVCAPSNVAVDNLVEKLVENNVKNVLRLGHPARALPSSQKVSLDAVLAASDDYRLIDDIRREIDGLRKNTGAFGVRTEIKQLIKELKRREKKALSESLFKSKAIVSTLTTAASDGVLKNLLRSDCPENQFDVVVIDECSQAIEASCWIVLTFAPKCVLAGDHKQLPPTIVSEKAAKEGLEVTLMERLLDLHPQENIMRMLTIQYRMNEKIMQWSSSRFYDDKLVAHESNANSTLSDIVGSVNISPILLIDTTGCFMYELEVDDEHSKGNEGEANLVTLYIQSLIDLGVDSSTIGVITPYNLQVEMIRNRLSEKYPNLEIKSVDGFQGREKEVIILSLVRSNDRREVGFLSEYRRINVAVTRAKRHVAIICDSETVCHDSNLNSLVEYASAVGEVRSAHEYESKMKQFDDFARPEQVKCKTAKPTKRNRDNTNRTTVKPSKTTAEHKQQISEDELKRRENIKQKYLKIVSNFVNSVDTRYSFPKNLSSFERRFVHEISEQFDLCHVSKGENKDRIIEIWKPTDCECTPQSTCSSTEEVVTPKPCISLEEDEIDEKLSIKKEAENISKTSQKKTKPKQKVKAMKENGNVKVKNLSEQLKTTDEENIDELIATVKKMDSVCSFENCKSKVSVLGLNCQFCKRRFCLSHSMPEIHGCGDDVRALARSVARKEGKLYPGTGVPTKKCDSVRHAQLQRLLNKKVDELSDKRKPKRK